MQPDEGVEDEQPWIQSFHGVGKTLNVIEVIEAEAGRGDYMHVELRERDAGDMAYAREALTNDLKRVLGGEEQNTSTLRYGEAAQAGCAGSDRDGEIKGEETFAGLRLPTNQADGLFAPQSLDEPAGFIGVLLNAMGLCDWEETLAAHRRLRRERSPAASRGAASVFGME